MKITIGHFLKALVILIIYCSKHVDAINDDKRFLRLRQTSSSILSSSSKLSSSSSEVAAAAENKSRRSLVTKECEDDEDLFFLRIRTDKWGEQMQWWIKNDCNNNILFSTGITGEYYNDENTYYHYECLPKVSNGNQYTFTILDDGSDGFKVDDDSVEQPYYLIGIGDEYVYGEDILIQTDGGESSYEHHTFGDEGCDIDPLSFGSYIQTVNNMYLDLDCDSNLEEELFLVFYSQNVEEGREPISWTLINECTDEILVEKSAMEYNTSYINTMCIPKSSEGNMYNLILNDSAAYGATASFFIGLGYDASYAKQYEEIDTNSSSLDTQTFGSSCEANSITKAPTAEEDIPANACSSDEEDFSFILAAMQFTAPFNNVDWKITDDCNKTILFGRQAGYYDSGYYYETGCVKKRSEGNQYTFTINNIDDLGFLDGMWKVAPYIVSIGSESYSGWEDAQYTFGSNGCELPADVLSIEDNYESIVSDFDPYLESLDCNEDSQDYVEVNITTGDTSGETSFSLTNSCSGEVVKEMNSTAQEKTYIYKACLDKANDENKYILNFKYLAGTSTSDSTSFSFQFGETSEESNNFDDVNFVLGTGCATNDDTIHNDDSTNDDTTNNDDTTDNDTTNNDDTTDNDTTINDDTTNDNTTNNDGTTNDDTTNNDETTNNNSTEQSDIGDDVLFDPSIETPECFAGTTIVQLKGKGPTYLKNAVVGDKVLSGSGKYETIYAIDHSSMNKKALFIQVYTNSINKSIRTVASHNSQKYHQEGPLELTRQHLIYIHGKKYPIPASKLHVGDKIQTLNGPKVVTQLSIVLRSDGYMNVLTTDGNIVVSEQGIITSAYSASYLLHEQNKNKTAGSNGLTYLHNHMDEYMKLSPGGFSTMVSYHSFYHEAVKPLKFFCMDINSQLCKLLSSPTTSTSFPSSSLSSTMAVREHIFNNKQTDEEDETIIAYTRFGRYLFNNYLKNKTMYSLKTAMLATMFIVATMINYIFYCKSIQLGILFLYILWKIHFVAKRSKPEI